MDASRRIDDPALQLPRPFVRALIAHGFLTFGAAAAKSDSMSFAVERRAPAPANVGESQLPTGSSSRLCPVAMRARTAGGSVIPVDAMPNGPVIRARTNAS